jgi:hypothetical protein
VSTEREGSRYFVVTSPDAGDAEGMAAARQAFDELRALEGRFEAVRGLAARAARDREELDQSGYERVMAGAGDADWGDDPMEVRPEPCATCPYRRSVPAGIWAGHEYAKLEEYDGTTTEQAVKGALGVFNCHSSPDLVCAGWAAVAGTPESIALRLAAARGRDPRPVLRYRTEVPLFGSGREAAEHGRSGIEHPDEEAKAAVEKVVKAREATGRPVTFE